MREIISVNSRYSDQAKIDRSDGYKQVSPWIATKQTTEGNPLEESFGDISLPKRRCHPEFFISGSTKDAEINSTWHKTNPPQFFLYQGGGKRSIRNELRERSNRYTIRDVT
jgi:hypothetical protein